MKRIFKIIKFIYIFLKIKYLKKNKAIKNISNDIENTGPVFIKLAQILSVRADIFPNFIIKELEKLQTHTKHIHYSNIKNIISNNNTQIKKIIKKINENSIASASVAQIHTALLYNNKKIVIKILKPHIKNEIIKDINFIKKIAKIINIFLGNFKRLKLLDIVDELKISFENEINFNNETKYMLKIKKNLNNLNNVYIPNILEDISGENILFIEYIDGINIINNDKINKDKINKNKITKNLFYIFYKQAFEYNIFHADLHPGNILISKTNLNDPIIILIDFGIISKLSNEEKIYLSENIFAFTKKNYKKIIHLHIKAKTIKTKKNIKKMENDLHKVFSKIYNKKIKEIDFKNLLFSLIKISKKFNMQMQPNLISFQKTLVTLEAISRKLNKNINLWEITRNIMEKIILNNLLTFNLLNNKKKYISEKKISEKKQIISIKNIIYSKKNLIFITLFIILNFFINLFFIYYKTIIILN